MSGPISEYEYQKTLTIYTSSYGRQQMSNDVFLDFVFNELSVHPAVSREFDNANSGKLLD